MEPGCACGSQVLSLKPLEGVTKLCLLWFSACGERNSLLILGFQTTCKITKKVGEAPV